MTVASKLAGFAVVLVLVFGAAALAGSRLDAHPGATSAEQADTHGMGGHGDSAELAPQPVRGLAVSDRGLTLRLEHGTAAPRERFGLAFKIVDRRGQALRDFDVEHTKRMHFIVVRRDLTGFQHLHPAEAPDGTWSVPVTLRDPGTYRVFADFSVDGTAHTLADDLTVDGTVHSRPMPAPEPNAEVDGLRVSLTEDASTAGAESGLSFDVTRDGKRVALEPYLGARGHLVALRQGDLAFLHVHPDESSLRFMSRFPSPGRYRLFLQFETGERVHTAAFTQEVSP